ncbi:NAD(P)-dependent oxidoreductase [Scrofimicrobium canadense]|uniref:NAD(P)-dependent oxidoreductase n=1 Tax=Scrofimicrobium canadense TaxID=2652290 RepID=UPI0021F0B146|nr:NAD(P)-dependent oxidoreductase [Scrofimicrobium canadense]
MADRGGLYVPVIAVNDAQSKTLFDNRYGTGQTCAFAIDHEAHGNTWAIIGYGPVGAGVAQCARALGKTVSVVEIDPIRALEAASAGYHVETIEEALAADVVVSATGYARTITNAHMDASHAVFAVAGGAPEEAPSTALAGGHGINYTVAEGNPIEIMDMSFACQLFAVRQLITTVRSPCFHFERAAYQKVSWLPTSIIVLRKSRHQRLLCIPPP